MVGKENAASSISRRPTKKCPKTSETTAATFAIFLPRENKRIADELGVHHNLLNRATDKKYSFFHFDKPQKLIKRNFDEDI